MIISIPYRLIIFSINVFIAMFIKCQQMVKKAHQKIPESMVMCSGV